MKAVTSVQIDRVDLIQYLRQRFPKAKDNTRFTIEVEGEHLDAEVTERTPLLATWINEEDD